MITNQFISLDPQSKERIDAQNIIKYTLLLDYKIPALQKNSELFIQEVIDQTQECCSKLFGYESTIYYNFFGQSSSQCRNSLAHLDVSYNPYDSRSSKKPSFSQPLRMHDMILHNSVMSAYHALLTELLSSMQVPSFTLNKFKKMGCYNALQEKYIYIEKNKLKLNRPKLNTFSPNTPTSSGKASDFNKTIENRFLIASDFTSFLQDSENTHERYYLQYISLYNALNEVSPAELKTLHSRDIDSSSLEPFFDTLKSLTDHLTPALNASALSSDAFPVFNNNIVDSMYQYYLAEKVYNLNLFASLLLNISHTEKQDLGSFDNRTLKVLSCCQKLPNPFSRTIFLRYAFERIDNKYHSYQDYWNYHNIHEQDTIVKTVSANKRGFHFDKWLLQFEQFVTYMSDHIIPIYDWCFISMLLNAIEAYYPNDTHLLHLQKALDLLAQYIAQNHKKFLQPIKLKNAKEMEGLDIISPKKLVLNDFSYEKVDFLRSLFFSSCNTKLNLKPLDLALFKGDGIKNIRAIQDFYIDLRFNFF